MDIFVQQLVNGLTLGAVYAIVHHIVVKTTLFLVGGLVEHAGGSSRLTRLGSLVARVSTRA